MLVLLTLAASPAFCAEEIDRIVAIVGPRVIALSELQTEMAPAQERLNQTLRGEELARAADKLKRATLDSLIDKSLQLQEAKLQGIEVSDADIDAAVQDIMSRNRLDKAGFTQALMNEGYTFEDYKKSLADQLKILKIVTRAIKSKITIDEGEIKKYYEDNKAGFTQDESVKVAHIFFPATSGRMEDALKNAQAAKAEVMAGASFEEMAAKCSGDKDAAKTCVLGTFGKGQLSKAVEEKAFSLAAGEVSEPIKMDGGYRLIKVMEHSPAGLMPMEDVRGRIVEELSGKQGETLFARWVQELRKHTYVEIRD